MKSVLVLVMVIVMIGCTSTRTQENEGEHIDDTFITAKVKAAFATEPTLSVFDIEAETFKGVVQLRGIVNTPEQAQKAGEIASSVKGVKSVQNSILVKVVKQESPAEYIGDSVISAKIRAALVADTTISASDVKVEVYRGVAQLSGFVDTDEQIRKAGEIAAGIIGVISVQNNITTK